MAEADFTAQVSAWSKETVKNADQIMRAVALEVLRRVVIRSPVGNPELWAVNAHNAKAHAPKGYVGGRFRGNWQISIGEPLTGELPDPDPTGTVTLSAGAAALEQPDPGLPIFIVNNLPYARRLEYGWSKQAPQGMVRITVAELQEIVKRIGVSLSSNQEGA